MSLLEKPNKNTLRLKHWRPLALLNTDNKIFVKALAARIQGIQNKITHESQTGFVKGRQLSENIIKIMEIMQNCENHHMNGLLVSFDFEKAFDTIEWEAIFHTMEKFNFGENFIKMSKILYNHPLVTLLSVCIIMGTSLALRNLQEAQDKGVATPLSYSHL